MKNKPFFVFVVLFFCTVEKEQETPSQSEKTNLKQASLSKEEWEKRKDQYLHNYYNNLVKETIVIESQKPLPSGWEMRKDPSHGRVFYVDHANKNVKREIPDKFESDGKFNMYLKWLLHIHCNQKI